MNASGQLTGFDHPEIRPLTDREFEQFRSLAHQEFGLDLRGGKEQLVSARLRNKLRELNLSTFQDYYDHVLNDRTGEALTAMIDALTTNHTGFFREPAHFDFLRRMVLPQLKQKYRMAIWSAGCSTGEEPYSVAFALHDELGTEAMARIRILATDISTRALENARRAVYPAERFADLPEHQLRQYVRRGASQWQDWYLVKKELRASIEFRRLNLMESISHLGLFSVIFCRNVMIYFDRRTQQDLVNRLADCLEPGGYLFIGHSESLNGIGHALKHIQPAIFRKAEGGRMGRYR